MSRIVLSRYPDGEQRVVVGYDPPLRCYFAQEFAPIVDGERDGELLRYYPSLTQSCGTVAQLQVGMKSAGFERRLTPQVVDLLREHATLEYPDSNVVVDLSA